ncbi:MAG: hypothetical protein KDB86_09985 [Actinobacteria bacterium]|nr:hypothetical protein [Actinomycetota bacterium]MCB9390276.1 hypothetical protein [Acidimicrobiia bacterium]
MVEPNHNAPPEPTTDGHAEGEHEPEEKPVGTLVVTFAFLAATIAVWLLMYYTLLSKA